MRVAVTVVPRCVYMQSVPSMRWAFSSLSILLDGYFLGSLYVLATHQHNTFKYRRAVPILNVEYKLPIRHATCRIQHVRAGCIGSELNASMFSTFRSWESNPALAFFIVTFIFYL